MYRLTIREGAKVAHSSHEQLRDALAELERRLAGVDHERAPVRWIGRDIDPVQQVVARGEVAGRRVRGGVDVRGDGSTEAFTGRLRKRLVAQERGESAYDALARVLSP